MNVYDFDKTIYPGNSTVNFYFYLLPRHPSIVLYVPLQIYSALRYYLFKKGDKTQHKATVYRFFKRCNAEQEAKDFWQTHRRHLKCFYTEHMDESDVIVSASPEFFLKPLEELLPAAKVIASPVSPKDGSALGENCYYNEKVRRFYELFPDGEIDEFYSDSLSDEPMARLSKNAYIVTGSRVHPWDFSKHKKKIHL